MDGGTSPVVKNPLECDASGAAGKPTAHPTYELEEDRQHHDGNDDRANDADGLLEWMHRQYSG